MTVSDGAGREYAGPPRPASAASPPGNVVYETTTKWKTIQSGFGHCPATAFAVLVANINKYGYGRSVEFYLHPTTLARASGAREAVAMFARALALCGVLALELLVARSAAAGGVLLFGDMGPNQTFNARKTPWCISGYSTPDCGPPVTRWVAMDFIPSRSDTLSHIYVAIQNYSGTNSVIVDLLPDFEGTPANSAPLEEWTLSGLPVSVPTFTAQRLNSVRHPRLAAGTRYWVVAKPASFDNDTLDVWMIAKLPRGHGEDGLTSGLTWTRIGRNYAPALEVRGD